MNRLHAAVYLATHPKRSPDVILANLMANLKMREAIYRYTDWRDRDILKSTHPIRVPPASLRFRVHGDLSVQSFLQSGQQCSQDIQHALAQAGVSLGSLTRILDFGCGCGRTLGWLTRIS